MISKDYKQHKEQVLDLFGNYARACEQAGKKVDESIQKQADCIKNEIFNLMILGEAKSGKSTFINAYLGKRVVPMDVRQCTSAIIKIRRGDKFTLDAKSAVGGHTKVTGDDKIAKFLKDHAAISDKYRNIPVTTINNELLIKFKGKIPRIVMDSFLEEAEYIYNVDKEEYNRLIREYVVENAGNWEKIIVEMEITYPLPEEMQGIIVIDSPGVGAGGNVGKIAEDYISEANAIIFVKSLNGQALESSSFMDFLRNTCTNRKKEFLFLVLTGKANLQGDEFARLKEQAVEMYRKDIGEEKIICVDSKAQLFLNDCRELGTAEDITAYFDGLDKAGNDFDPASKRWYKAKGNVERFEEFMEELSNFNSVRTAIEEFARGANYLQLIEFLDNLKKECIRYQVMYADLLKIAKENVEDPEALKDKIERKKREIGEAYVRMTAGIEQIQKKYIDNINGEGIIIKEADDMRKKYEEELAKFCQLPEGQINDTTFSSMKKMTMDTIDDTKGFIRVMADRVIEECNQELIQCTDEIPAEAYIPNFTESDFDSINESARADTSGYRDVEDGVTFFKTTEKVPYHDLKEHVKRVANSIRGRLDADIIPKMINNMVGYVNKCAEIYKEKLQLHEMELQNEYQKLLEDKESNEKRRMNVEELEKKVKDIKWQLASIAEKKEELENHVKR